MALESLNFAEIEEPQFRPEIVRLWKRGGYFRLSIGGVEWVSSFDGEEGASQLYLFFEV
jgi:hypothetical protein